MTCEACWEQAFIRALVTGGTQVEHYRALLEENDGKPGHE